MSFWRLKGRRYYAVGAFFERAFGQRAWKVSVDAGFDCPNRDGTLATGGCRFCNPASFSPSRRRPAGTIGEQIRLASARLADRHRAERFLAYFQPGTNTYGPLARLRTCYEEALDCPSVVGLIVGTRPDCVPDDVLDLLAELAQRTWVSVELGLQSIHDQSLGWLRRGHRHDASIDAVTRAKQRGLHVGAHVILGLPTETRDDMIATADELARLKIDAVKLHNLYVAPDTPLADDYASGRLVLPQREQYVDFVVHFLEHLRADCAIDRLSSDAPPDYLVAPDWCRDKAGVRLAVEAELERRDSYQSEKCEVGSEK
ncbi:MAG: TIGR01212 family radical SAM protein [Pirellulales bacterium]|nr:TIGR01212 family radical SAM protein [Pirellulales bacterium]